MDYYLHKHGVNQHLELSERKMYLIENILLLYVYFPYFWNIAENSFHVPAYVEYILKSILVCWILVINMRINKKVLLFLIIFVSSVIINYFLVDYRYYVFVEGVQAFLGIAIPCLCVSSYKFHLDKFIEKWYRVSFYDTILVLISIVLLKLNYVHYSIFTSICVPNVFIISYMILEKKSPSKTMTIIALLNIAITAVLGGRMAAIVSACMLVLSFIYSRNIQIWKKLFFIIMLFLSAFFVLNYFEQILLFINEILNKYGIHSRSVTLLITQLSTKELYVTGRDSIYSVCIDYIKHNMGMPGGFGVALHLTNGEYYYTHNLFLQLLVMFGIPGAIIVIIATVYRFLKCKKSFSPAYIRLLLFMFFSYFLIGMTGSSIWINYLSTIFIALLFFNKSNR